MPPYTNKYAYVIQAQQCIFKEKSQTQSQLNRNIHIWRYRFSSVNICENSDAEIKDLSSDIFLKCVKTYSMLARNIHF